MKRLKKTQKDFYATHVKGLVKLKRDVLSYFEKRLNRNETHMTINARNELLIEEGEQEDLLSFTTDLMQVNQSSQKSGEVHLSHTSSRKKATDDKLSSAVHLLSQEIEAINQRLHLAQSSKLI